MSKELLASQLVWKKLRRIVVTTALAGAVAIGAVYLFSGGTVLLYADGLVTRQRVTVSVPWQDARIREVDVRQGDWVEAGQKVATVESAATSRALAELAAEKARLGSRVTQLDGRKTVVTGLLPLAETSAAEADTFLNMVRKARADGLAVNRSLHEAAAAGVLAAERLLSLRGEQSSLDAERAIHKAAFDQVAAAYDDLQRIYHNGALYAPAAGYVGGNVARVGDVMNASKDSVANIYTGTSFVLAYIPESYLFDVVEGQKVAVKARGQKVLGYVEKVLPMTEALPPEFQLPGKARGRGQLVRVAFSEKQDLAVDQKIQVTGCYLDTCGTGLSEIIRSGFPRLLGIGATSRVSGSAMEASFAALPAATSSARH